jgi:hypothetical protein
MLAGNHPNNYRKKSTINIMQKNGHLSVFLHDALPQKTT